MLNNKLVDSATPELPFYVNDHGLDSLLSVTIKSGTSALVGGTVLGKVTATGYYDAYADGNSDGTETAVGILFNRVDPTDGPVLGSMMIHGVVRSGSLTGIDSAAVADLRDEFQFV